MRLLLDQQFTPAVAELLSARGHDATAVSGDAALEGLADEPLLALAAAQGRGLVTNNVRHFVRLANDWAARGDVHGGLVFASDKSLPRSRHAIGLYVEKLAELLDAHPAGDALSGQTRWLS